MLPMNSSTSIQWFRSGMLVVILIVLVLISMNVFFGERTEGWLIYYPNMNNYGNSHPGGYLRDLTNDDPLWLNPPMDTKAEFIKDGLDPILLSFVNLTHDHLREEVGKPVKIPLSVHYVRFGEHMPFTFIDYLGLLGCNRYIRPNYIFMHADRIPSGYWWDKTVKEVPNIYYVLTLMPSSINGIAIRFIEHSSDIIRLDILYHYGGIYLDHDILVLRSFDPLRYYDVVLGEELEGSLANGVIVSRRGAPFLRLWRESYRGYKPHKWAYNSVQVPYRLSREFAHLVHVENSTLVRPNYAELSKLYGDEAYNWTSNYCVHLYRGRTSRGKGRPTKPADLDSANSTVGEIGRLLYYGDTRMRDIP